MLKSLYSGVSGLQSHQVAMDIESNNIANVNTTGYKYSRANFSDLLAQTSSIATAPQGSLGGKNAVQVGLGSTVSSMTRIFSQGSIQNSDKNTDVAIQGDGFFVISPDSGNTYKYTRAGDFKFDASGNFVDNNGFVTQGWLRNDVTGKVDSTAPIQNIKIAPGLTTPASPTAEVVLKANLNSGPLVKSFSPAYTIASTPPPTDTSPGPAVTSVGPSAVDAAGNSVASGDVGVMFNDSGEAYALQKNQGIWVSFIAASQAGTTAVTGGSGAKLDITMELDDGTSVPISATSPITDPVQTKAQNAQTFASAINAKTYLTGVTATVRTVGTESYIDLSNDNSDPAASHNIRVTTAGDDSGIANSPTVGTNVTAYKYQYDPSAVVTVAGADKKFGTIKDLREAMELQARAVGDNDVPTGGTPGTVTATPIGVSNAATITIGNIPIVIGDTSTTLGKTADENGVIYQDAINNAGIPGITAKYVSPNLTIYNANTAPIDVNVTSVGATGLITESIAAATGDGTANENNIAISVNANGDFEITNPGSSDDGDYIMNIKVTGIHDKAAGILENTKFSDTMQALNSILPIGSTAKATSQGFNAATHSSSIDIFDSLGSKHTVSMAFRKISVEDTNSAWALTVTVPTPSTISTIAPTNQKTDVIKFNPDGSLLSPANYSLSFSANNGSSSDQPVSLHFGTANGFDGMTSFDSASSTSGISQDGFTGGDLVGIRIDQSGTVIGSFSNGRSFGLAQIAMAKFTNNEGLSTEGGNVYIQTANSGDPIIGTAATSGRGFIQSSALEASNVDLSRALTQLIIIQRGYQANGKTITTSDQLLQTLIGLKN